jgi:hypothetical protein
MSNRFQRPTNVINENTGQWKKRILIGTPATGTVRMEWVMARFGQIIPTNWSSTDMIQWISSYIPLKYLVPDAQNIIAKTAIEQGFEWVLLIEQDNVLPPDAFLKINDYMRKGDIPVVSGLYFTKSVPPEPMIYRGRGNSYFDNWKMGDKVWCDGVPTGFVLIHTSILKAMWAESPEYQLPGNGGTVRRIFETPEKVWYDPETGGSHALTGTSDLTWCERVIKEGFLAKAGWKEIAKKEHPFLVDTNIFVKHIDDYGRQYPLQHPTEFGH